jgi:hypothetical protein
VKHLPPSNRRGSVLVVTLSTIAILSLLAAHVCRVVTARSRTFYQAASWNESLCAAEAGADLAIAALRQNDWTGWQGPNAKGVRTLQTPVLTHGGEGNTTFSALVNVDSPDGTYTRIRSSGIAQLSGGAVASYDKLDNRLRRLSLRSDRDTGAKVTGQSRVTRTIEVIARGANPYTRALLLTSSLTANNSGSFADSFDSGDPTKSTNGLYDINKRQSKGDISINDSTGSDLNGMHIYGDLSYSGPVVPNTQNVHGDVITPFADQAPPVPKPNWTSVTANMSTISASTTLKAGAPGSPTRYKVANVNLSSGGVLTFSPPAAGQQGEVEVWVPGSFLTGGSGRIVSQPGVKVKIYTEGTIELLGNAVMNQSNVAASMQFFGVSPSDGTPRSAQVGGSSSFVAVLNAPAYDLKINGGGEFYGSFLLRTVTMKGGNTAIHYDEALPRSGGTLWKMASWTEDVR